MHSLLSDVTEQGGDLDSGRQGPSPSSTGACALEGAGHFIAQSCHFLI